MATATTTPATTTPATTTTATTTPALALHAERVAGSPDLLRWLLPDVTLPVGRLVTAPGRLGELLADGTLAQAWCEPHAVVLRVGAGGAWRDLGTVVQDAVRDAVGQVGDWRTDDDRDGVLRVVVAEVLAGPAGDYVRSHGGTVEVLAVSGDEVTVRFGGACGHCPAAGLTLHDRVEAAVRHRYPRLRAVHDATATRRSRTTFVTLRRGRRPAR